MRLNDPLVTSFIYEGKEYAINLAFDVVLDVFDTLNRNDLRRYEKAELCLYTLLRDQPYDQLKSIELWNHIYETFIYTENKKTIQYDLKGNPMPSKNDSAERYIDLEQDAKYIYSSFEQAYNINIFEQQGKMHWDLFQSLLNGLPSNTIMQRIIRIRQWEPSKGDTEEQRNQMRELQEVYALDDTDSEGVDE